MLLTEKLLLCALIICCICGAPRAEDSGFSARGVFISLPTSIFDNVSDGLGDEDKEDLIFSGKSAAWEIASESADEMIFAALPEDEPAIGLKIYHNGARGGALAAYGTLNEPICSLELWTISPAGRIMPADTPEEPDIGEFFARGRHLKKSRHSVMICFAEDGLEARALFWDKKGVRPARTDYRISYRWNGDGFEKVVEKN